MSASPLYDLILQGTFIANNSSTYFNEAYDIKERNISKQLYVETVLKEHFLDDKTFSNYTAAPEVQPLLAHVSYMLELNKWKEHCKSQVVEPVKRPEKSHTSRSLVASTTTKTAAATAPLAPLTSAKSAAPVAVAPSPPAVFGTNTKTAAASPPSTVSGAPSSSLNLNTSAKPFTPATRRSKVTRKSTSGNQSFVFVDTKDNLEDKKAAEIYRDGNNTFQTITDRCVASIKSGKPISRTCYEALQVNDELWQ